MICRMWRIFSFLSCFLKISHSHNTLHGPANHSLSTQNHNISSHHNMIHNAKEHRINKYLKQLSEDSAFRIKIIPLLTKFVQQNISENVILSSATGDKYLQSHSSAIINNICYAITHNIRYDLDMNSYKDVPLIQEKMHYRKLYSLIQTLPKTNHMLWLDVDTIILTNENIFEVVNFTTADLIIADHSHIINNVVFFLRNTTYSQHLLQRWWDISRGSQWTFIDKEQFYFYSSDRPENQPK